MSKCGVFIIAQNNEKNNYHKMAYLLALSIKKFSPNIPISVAHGPDETFSEKYHHVFDQIIPIIWGDHAKEYDEKYSNEWKTIYMSPYDITLKLEADMLVTSDLTPLFKLFENMDNDLLFTTNIINFRGDIITNIKCRQTFIKNELPNIYSAMFFFNKSKKSFEFFKMAELIFNNWQLFFSEFIEYPRPTKPYTDEVFALSLSLLNFKIPQINNFPTFVHMKMEALDFEKMYDSSKWHELLPFHITDNYIKIGNYTQSAPIHYCDKQFCTSELIGKFEHVSVL